MKELMKVDRSVIQLKLMEQFPRASMYLLDRDYVLPTRKLWTESYESFQEEMWAKNLTKWESERLDCDKWAWLFKAHCLVRHAVSAVPATALPVGILCYPRHGISGHAINVVASWHNNDVLVECLEPQPNNGWTELSNREKEGAWLIVI